MSKKKIVSGEQYPDFVLFSPGFNQVISRYPCIHNRFNGFGSGDNVEKRPELRETVKRSAYFRSPNHLVETS